MLLGLSSEDSPCFLPSLKVLGGQHTSSLGAIGPEGAAEPGGALWNSHMVRLEDFASWRKESTEPYSLLWLHHDLHPLVTMTPQRGQNNPRMPEPLSCELTSQQSRVAKDHLMSLTDSVK